MDRRSHDRRLRIKTQLAQNCANSAAESLLGGFDRDDPPAPAARELHGPAVSGIDRVVLADPDAVTGLELGAALAHDDLAAGHGLAGEDLHAEALGVRVAA